MIGITRALALSGCTDFQWVDEESKWKGSEVHRIVELANRGTLDRKSVPSALKGYYEAQRKFMKETRFIPLHIEKKVESKELGLRGRIDAAGLLRGKPTIVDFKTSQSIAPAVALQLCLGGKLLDPLQWWARCAVRLGSNGEYSIKHFSLHSWHADLSTALCAVRIAQWRTANGMA